MENHWNWTMSMYINRNALVEAYERYKQAYWTWESRWWKIVETIYKQDKKWFYLYIIDTEKCTLVKRDTHLIREQNIDKLSYLCEAEGCGAYIVQHFNGNMLMWTKCGKANDVDVRLAQQINRDYAKQVTEGVCVAFFPCKSSNEALAMESIIREHYENLGYTHLYRSEDRFDDLCAVSDQDIQILNEKLQVLHQLF